MKKKIFVFIFLIALVAPMFAMAATPCTLQSVQNKTGQEKSNELPRCINQIYVWSLGVASLLALLMMVVGGYYYMTASGNAEQSSKGVEMIWGAVIGLAILFGAYLLLNTINPDLVNFKFQTTGFDTQVPRQTTPGP